MSNPNVGSRRRALLFEASGTAFQTNCHDLHFVALENRVFLRVEKQIMGLIGISPIISPDLLVVLARMGHGDTICFADTNFPCESLQNANRGSALESTFPSGSVQRGISGTTSPIVIRADGHEIAPLLKAVAQLFPLDTYVDYPVQMMAAVNGDTLDPNIEQRYREAIESSQPGMFNGERLERFKFYDRARSAYAVVATGETAKYGNIILTKGVLSVGVDSAGYKVFQLPS